MNHFRQHVPMFVNDGEGGASFDFETTQELLAHPVVRRYIGPTHSHFALSDHHLLEISDDGFAWWVVGSIRNPHDVNLPPWDGWKHLVRLTDGREVVLTDEVVSSCGGQLLLRDGSVGIDIRYERQMAKQAADSKKRDMGICPKCDVSFIRTESPDDSGMITVDSRCNTCGFWMTHWRRP